MAYGDFKDLHKRYLLRKYYLIKQLTLLKIQNMMGIKEVLLRWFIKLLNKKNSGGAVKSYVKNYVKSSTTRRIAKISY